MAELTATAAEARANFAKIAAMVNKSGKPVTVLKNSRPWVTISPVTDSSPVTEIDWLKIDVKRIDPKLGFALLPSEWDNEADEGLYDDLV